MKRMSILVRSQSLLSQMQMANLTRYCDIHCLLGMLSWLEASLCIPLTFEGHQILTAIVAVALIFRYAVKIWIRWAVPHVSAPERSWGLEDFLFFTGYAVDVIHMTTAELRYILSPDLSR